MNNLNKAFAGTLLALLALIHVSATNAQGTLTPAPIRPTLDKNGVELRSGGLYQSSTDVTIGKPGAGGLTFIRSDNNGAWSHEYRILILGSTDNGTTTSATVAIGNYTETFNKADSPSSSPFASAQGTGATLTTTSTTYTYTSAGGTVYVFSKSINMVETYGGIAYVTSMTLPNGEVRTFNYLTAPYCQNTGCPSTTQVTRLQSVTNNLGYQIKLLYQQNATPYPFLSAWTQLVGVMGINMAVDYCAPLATSCGGTTQTWPAVSYGSSPGCLYGATDASGGVTCYESGNTPFDVTWPGNSSPNITYLFQGGEGVGAPVTQVTRNGQIWHYAYSYAGNGDPTTVVTDPLSRTSTYVFDATTYALKSYTNTAGELTAYQNDSNGRVSVITLPSGRKHSYVYDARGNVKEFHRVAYPTGAADLIVKANYPSTCTAPKTCNKPTWTQDAMGNQTDYTYDATSGMVATMALPAPTAGGIRPKTTYSYTQYQAYYKNSSGTIVSSGTNVSFLTSVSTCRTTASCTSGSTDQLRTDITYGVTAVANNRLPVTTTNRDGAGSLIATTTYEYDVFGNVVAIDGPLGSSVQRTAMTYDAVRRLTGTVGPDPDGTGSRLNIGVRTTYDSRGFPTAAATGTLPGQTAAAWQSFQPYQTVIKQFDAEGRELSSSLMSGSTYSMQQTDYDELGRVQCLTTRMNSASFSGEPASACTQGSMGSFGPDRITQYNYYSNSDRVQSIVSGVGTASPVTKQTNTYYPGGQLSTMTDGNGYTTSYGYDVHGRLVQVNYPDLTTVGASSTSDHEIYTVDANSNLTSVQRRNGDLLTFNRDALGRISSRGMPIAADSVAYTYDNQNRLLSALYNSGTGNGITQTYDGLGRTKTRTTYGRQLSYGYDLADRRTQLTYPETGTNAFSLSYGYSNLGELQTIADSTGTVAAYAYDAMGARTNLTRPNSANTTYVPNAIEQLGELKQDLAGTAYDSDATFTYNPTGQVVTKSQINDTAYTWLPSPASQTIATTFDKQNKLAAYQGIGVTYDDNSGNVKAGINNLSYSYNSLGQLQTVTGGASAVTLAYDPDGMLQKETNGSTTTEYLYDGGDLVAQYVNGTLTQRFVHGAGSDEPLVWYQGTQVSSPKMFLHADERGSIIAASNSAGVAAASVKYGAYGESGSLVSPFGYTGQVYLPDIQLYYYKARMYSPQIGRFLQPDPTGYADGTNMYNYAGADPINALDPTGLRWVNNCWFEDLPPSPPPVPGIEEVTATATQQATFCSPDIAPLVSDPSFSSSLDVSSGGSGPQTRTTNCSGASQMAALQAKMAGQPSTPDPLGPISADVAVMGETGDVLDNFGTSLAKSGGRALSHGAVGVGVVLNGVTAVQAVKNNDPETAVYKTIDSGVDVAAAAGGGFVGGALAFVFDLFGGSQKMAQGYAYAAVAQSAAGLAMICGTH